MIFHCLGIPHTITSQEYCACAYTGKILKFIKMMTARGHTCLHYGHPDSEVDCETIPVIARSTFERNYKARDTRNKFFQFSIEEPAYREHVARSIEEIGRRKQSRGEFLLSFFGWAGKKVCDYHRDLMVVEPGIGYSSGHFAPYKVFESYALYHEFYGLENSRLAKMEWTSCVIPNYFDPADFSYRDGGDYLLFLGRIYEGKGVHLVIQAAREMPEERFVIAGQNRCYVDDNYGPGKRQDLPPNVEVVGFADRDRRRDLYKHAKGVFCLSKYLEPFGGVAVEAMMSGTPVIASDWGAFTETVLHGQTGYRVRSFEQILWAARNVDKLSGETCRQWAMNYALAAIAPRYEEYFQLVENIHSGRGWYCKNDGRLELDHMKVRYPGGGV